MTSLLDKSIVLQLNKSWQRLGYTTPRKAIVAMCGGCYGGTPAALGLPVEVNEDGKFDIGIPLTWEEWMKLPVGASDLAIQTQKGPVRCPTVVISPNYAKMPLIVPRLTRKAILERDGHRCQYTGRVLPVSQLNVDHVIPRDRGGKDTWDNLVASEKQVNTKKGNKLNEEVGLKLIRKPVAPRAVPKSFTIREAKHPSHTPFLG